MWLMQRFGQWQLLMLFSCTTMFLIWQQASVQVMSSSDGSKGSVMTYMFGDVQSMLWRKQLQMASSYPAGNQEPFVVLTRDFPRNMQAQFPWF
jgi:hypothetical protein